MKKKFAIFVSGYGRGAIYIINSYLKNKIKPDIGLLISTNAQSEAYNLAKILQIPSFFINKKDFDTKLSYEEKLLEYLDLYCIDYIFLSGYNYIITSTILDKYQDRIVNIHPSLLPSFPGVKAIDQALNYGVKITGVTTHYVNYGIDTGKIICQRAVSVDENDAFSEVDKKIFNAGKKVIIETINKNFI
ncbi:MAG: phosphoribosylglycinamide formyltransferase [Bacteroidales bacterium]|nr:phosphoribosylglycinamide formyltransferase [Bacteroidales bacterium]